MPATIAVPPPAALRQLPPFPPVALKLLRLLADPNASFVEAAALLRSDPALSAELLRLANSPLVGMRREVTSILQALSLLGIQRIGGLLSTLVTSRLLRGCHQLEIARRCWRHSLASACAAEELAGEFGVETETAYTAGLLHDVGRLGLLASDPVRYAKLAEQKGLSAEGFSAAEESEFGMTHTAAGFYLAERWGLPRIFWDVIRCHHGSASSQAPLVRLIQTACVTADEAGFSALPESGEPVDQNLAARIAMRVNAAEVSLV